MNNPQPTGEKTIRIRQQLVDPDSYDVDCPAIHVAGKWLEELGFFAGNHAQLIHAPGIVIVATLPLPEMAKNKILDILTVAALPMSAYLPVSTVEPKPYAHPGAITTTPPTPPSP